MPSNAAMNVRAWSLSRASWLSRICGLLSLVACSRSSALEAKGDQPFEVLKLRYQGQVGQVLLPELAEDLGYLAPIELAFVGNTISGPQDIQTVVTRDIEFGAAFNGAVINLMAAHAPIESVIAGYGVDRYTWGGFFVLENSPIHDAKDLLDAKVAVNTVGAHSEFMLREYLSRQGLGREQARQVTLVVVPPINTEPALRQGQVEVAMLDTIFRDKALERGGIRSLFSDYDMFGDFTAGSYVMAKDFIAKHPKATAKFIEATARAIEWARSTPRPEVVQRFRDILSRRARNEDDSLVQYWLSTGIAGKGGVMYEKEFQVWIDWLVKDGQLAPDQIRAQDLFTNQFNPFRAEAAP